MSRMRSRTLTSIVIWSCACVACGTDMDLGLAVAPVSVHADELLGKRRVVVDWGAVSQAIPRTADDCDNDYYAVVAGFKASQSAHEPEIEARRAEARAAALAEIAKTAEDADTSGQSCDLMRSTQVETRHGPLADWMRSIPQEVRKDLVLALFDAGDADQRRWAERQATAEPNIQMLALGWSSQAELDQWRHDVPTISNLVTVVAQPGMSPRDLAGRYGVDILPAVIRFREAEVVTTIGIGSGGTP